MDFFQETSSVGEYGMIVPHFYECSLGLSKTSDVPIHGVHFSPHLF